MPYTILLMLFSLSIFSWNAAAIEQIEGSKKIAPATENSAIESTDKENLVSQSGQPLTKQSHQSQTLSAYFPKTSKSRQTLGFRELITSAFYLSVIVAFIFFVSWLFKQSGLSPSSKQQLIKVISTVAVGHKEKISLIEVGNQQVLIGISPGNIQKLLVLETPVELHENALNEKPDNKFSAGFSSQLIQHFRAKKNVK
ncbi:MAG: flagellar biosynthetic protein FliO [Pseudomonadota bacterium]